MKHKIYIPSKERENKCYTAELLKKYEIPYFIVVEPNEYNKYKEVYGEEILQVLDKNHMGVSYVRTWIKKQSEKNEEQYHWQIDDDIKQFQIRENQKNNNINPIGFFRELEKTIEQYENVTIVGLRDSLYAWTQNDFISHNKQVASVVLLKNYTNIYWDSGVIEDTDYCLQNLLKGYCTIIFNMYLYKKNPNNQGGRTSYEELKRNLVLKYYPFLKLRYDKKLGIWRVAPSMIWRSFKQRPMKKRENPNPNMISVP